MNDEGVQTLSHVVERDVDLLLVEELTCSSDFQQWFFNKIEPQWQAEPPRDVRVRHSVSCAGPGSGETDIEISALLGSLRVRLLLEDKVHSPFTTLQPQRYAIRGREAQRRSECDVYKCVLLCPAGYSTVKIEGFDRVITYEDVAAFLKARAASVGGELGRRLSHRCWVIEQAIGRQRRGYVAKPVAEVTSVWQAYYALASAKYADLRMPPPGEKPGDSYSVSFFCLAQHPALPKCRIEHVMERGTVTLLVAGAAASASAVNAALETTLPAGAFLRAAGKSLGITLRVTEIRRMGAAQDQVVAMSDALEAARQLKSWYERHAKQLADAVAAFLADGSRG